jgi:hypothetical protein
MFFQIATYVFWLNPLLLHLLFPDGQSLIIVDYLTPKALGKTFGILSGRKDDETRGHIGDHRTLIDIKGLPGVKRAVTKKITGRSGFEFFLKAQMKGQAALGAAGNEFLPIGGHDPIPGVGILGDVHTANNTSFDLSSQEETGHNH